MSSTGTAGPARLSDAQILGLSVTELALAIRSGTVSATQLCVSGARHARKTPLANLISKISHSEETAARAAMAKNFANGEIGLLTMVWGAFMDNLTEERRKKEAEGSLKEHEERLKAFNAAARKNAQKAMANMTAGNDAMLVEFMFNVWIEVLVEYKKDKEMNDLVRKQEQQLAELMKKQGQGAMDMIKKMGNQSAAGLLSNVIKEWKEVVDDIKQGAAVQEQLAQKASALAGRELLDCAHLRLWENGCPKGLLLFQDSNFPQRSNYIAVPCVAEDPAHGHHLTLLICVLSKAENKPNSIVWHDVEF